VEYEKEGEVMMGGLVLVGLTTCIFANSSSIPTTKNPTSTWRNPQGQGNSQPDVPYIDVTSPAAWQQTPQGHGGTHDEDKVLTSTLRTKLSDPNEGGAVGMTEPNRNVENCVGHGPAHGKPSVDIENPLDAACPVVTWWDWWD
jgi:hypothetical protein